MLMSTSLSILLDTFRSKFFFRSLYGDRFRYYTTDPVVVALIIRVKKATPEM